MCTWYRSMKSVRSRRSDCSQFQRMLSRERPYRLGCAAAVPLSVGNLHLVARVILSRLPCIHSPRSSSLRPSL